MLKVRNSEEESIASHLLRSFDEIERFRRVVESGRDEEEDSRSDVQYGPDPFLTRL